ncbi:MAG: alpha/beta fold hydrolase [Acetobacteraceae bacterium]|nr:alpha/beta fold hydrolase [Acetobacteraceae bacterium]
MSSALTRARSPATVARRDAVTPRSQQVLCQSRSGFHAIAYTEWGDPHAPRVAVCVHGLTRQGRDFDALAVALVQRGYRVVCPDLAGRGRSDWLGDPEDYAVPQYVSDMVTMLARTGAAEIDWIGTSLGGITGIHVAAMEKAPIRRMVVNDIGPFLPWNALTRLGNYLRALPTSFANFYAAEAYFREILAPFGRLGDTEWFHLTKHSIAREADGRFRLLVDPGIGHVFRPVMFYNVSMWRQWDAIRCPVLVLRGEHSDLLTRDVAYSMTQRGPRAKLVEFPECGHAPALMDHRQIGTVVHWLTRDSLG